MAQPHAPWGLGRIDSHARQLEQRHEQRTTGQGCAASPARTPEALAVGAVAIS
ncbi:hypothetical protein [Pyxidicoccus xibeiensis]|uniref:hypothetical protein n=1 Tax=Pyxidicoccus xibeiensis TaxID=2906759 RepID=UPI0020A7100A|nr:hypothetical protein [Pyxidicoccus xibeiensis]MCP3145358.1 hypothetical protein [Pyxidicoccus xibeiensis]